MSAPTLKKKNPVYVPLEIINFKDSKWSLKIIKFLLAGVDTSVTIAADKETFPEKYKII